MQITVPTLHQPLPRTKCSCGCSKKDKLPKHGESAIVAITTKLTKVLVLERHTKKLFSVVRSFVAITIEIVSKMQQWGTWILKRPSYHSPKWHAVWICELSRYLLCKWNSNHIDNYFVCPRNNSRYDMDNKNSALKTQLNICQSKWPIVCRVDKKQRSNFTWTDIRSSSKTM